MKNKIKFGMSTLLVLTISLNCASAQESKQPEQPIATKTSAEYQTLKKDWDEFQSRAEAKKPNATQKPILEKEYNGLVDRVESVCEGIRPEAKPPVKVATSTLEVGKPKKEQVSVMK